MKPVPPPLPLSLWVACQKSHLKNVRQFVEQTLAAYQVHPDEVMWVTLAIDELCTNLITHAHPHQPEHQVEVRILAGPGQGFTFEVHDPQADGFALADYQVPDPHLLGQQKRAGGYGLVLIHRLMDHLEVERQGAGMVCRLRRTAVVSPILANKP
ncbi:MAG: ATP-binding protein [Bernardetiaceae bacterium]|jgi:serine/threonine-protein kinase RsbW|nr:ATP-binding protein [Bernardetiaceae bacterium]